MLNEQHVRYEIGYKPRMNHRLDWLIATVAAVALPGGGIKRGETPEAAARRELAEEIGLEVRALIPAGFACGMWDGRRDRVHFFEVQLTHLPRLRLDNREIVAALLATPNQLAQMTLEGPLAAFLQRRT